MRNELMIKLVAEKTGQAEDTVIAVLDAYQEVQQQSINAWMENYHRIIMEGKENAKDGQKTEEDVVSESVSSDNRQP